MPKQVPTWTRHFVYRAERTKTTWKLRLSLLVFAAVTLWLTAHWWTAAIGRSLVCETSRNKSDAILVENFDPDYFLFERARALRLAGYAPRVMVPVGTQGDSDQPNAVALGFAEVMARISRLGPIEVIPVREVEPISLNVAGDVLRFFDSQGIRSVIVVTPLFRSRRSALVYQATLGSTGIAVRCEPVQGSRSATTWPRTWHGIQNVAEQWLKLLYYRLYVLPLHQAPHDSVATSHSNSAAGRM